VVARDVSKVVEIGGELGLSLNVSKCELISNDGFTVTGSLLQSFPKTCIGDVTLLGTPLFPDPSLDEAWSDQCAELARATVSLSQIGAQEALIFSGVLSVLRRCSICYAAHRRSLIQL